MRTNGQARTSCASVVRVQRVADDHRAECTEAIDGAAVDAKASSSTARRPVRPKLHHEVPATRLSKVT